MKALTEAQAKRLQIKANKDIMSVTREQCQALDNFISTYALEKVKAKLPPEPWKEFVFDTLRAHMGSIEVDDMLMKLDCYPPWMKEGKP